MQQGLTPKEAVRLAKENLGNATARELAAYIQESFGLTIKPPIVAVLLGTFQERATLDRSRQAAREKIERWKAENPEEARKIAETAKKREAAARRKAASQNGDHSPDAANETPHAAAAETASPGTTTSPAAA